MQAFCKFFVSFRVMILYGATPPYFTRLAFNRRFLNAVFTCTIL